MLREVGEQDKWKGIILTQGRGKGCWEPTCWERQRNHQGTLKHWLILLRSSHWFLNLFILFLWQFDGRVCTVEHVGYPCAYHVGPGLQRKEIVIGTQTAGGNVVNVILHHFFSQIYNAQSILRAMFLSLQTLMGESVTHSRFKLSLQFIIPLQLPKPTFRIGLFCDKDKIPHWLPTGISCKLFSSEPQILLSQIKLLGLYRTLGAKRHRVTSVTASFRPTQLSFTLCK